MDFVTSNLPTHRMRPGTLTLFSQGRMRIDETYFLHFPRRQSSTPALGQHTSWHPSQPFTSLDLDHNILIIFWRQKNLMNLRNVLAMSAVQGSYSYFACSTNEV